ncbi:MAG TPA: glycoside hydrolase family 127 protein, partial [Candidatus Hydrogenedentes bacterium]|nr:glycoside hydrolase family 127 protein [Candidatus Hydrogenedentota bacterium]
SVNANRPLGMIAQWAIMQDDEGLVLNFYGPGTYAAALPSGNRIALRQATEYPRDGNVRIEVTAAQAESFAIKLRIPQWSRRTTVSVNGEALPTPCPGAYLRIAREWRTGDTVELGFDFAPRFWAGAEAYANRASVYRGPLLLAYDARYNALDPGELPEIRWQSLSITQQRWDGPLDPWFLATLRDDAGAEFAVCDFSSAGQTGNHYRSWLLAS